MQAGDLIHSLKVLGASAVRLDANMFLGMGPGNDPKQGWLAEHPLSTQATVTLAMLIRKMGGYSFQELNTSLDRIAATQASGPELGYDFTTRPGYLNALVTGDAGPLRLTFREMQKYGVSPKRFVHGLQNHDELMLEATHFRVFGDQEFTWEGGSERGADLFKRLSSEVLAVATGDDAPYNDAFAMSPGVCSTVTGLIAAKLGIREPDTMDDEQRNSVRRLHLLAAAFNALQPGAFVVSGWDLVGALPVSRESVSDRLGDNDCRWINRGAYDLAGVAPSATHSNDGLPRATTLYGSLPDQLKDPQSFASNLKTMLAARVEAKLATMEVTAIPEVSAPGIIALVIEPPQDTSSDAATRDVGSPATYVTLINFGDQPAEETIELETAIETATVLYSTLPDADPTSVGVNAKTLKASLRPLEAIFVRVDGSNE
jgi:trehalose synthase